MPCHATEVASHHRDDDEDVPVHNVQDIWRSSTMDVSQRIREVNPGDRFQQHSACKSEKGVYFTTHDNVVVSSAPPSGSFRFVSSLKSTENPKRSKSCDDIFVDAPMDKIVVLEGAGKVHEEMEDASRSPRVVSTTSTAPSIKEGCLDEDDQGSGERFPAPFRSRHKNGQHSFRSSSSSVGKPGTGTNLIRTVSLSSAPSAIETHSSRSYTFPSKTHSLISGDDSDDECSSTAGDECEQVCSPVSSIVANAGDPFSPTSDSDMVTIDFDSLKEKLDASPRKRPLTPCMEHQSVFREKPIKKDNTPPSVAETDDSAQVTSDEEEARSISFKLSSNSISAKPQRQPERSQPSVPVTPVDRIPYVHGSYASAAPQMIHDATWMRILRRLLPATHADAMEILRAEQASSTSKRAPQTARIMKWAENNPVVAAYGIMNSDSGRAFTKSAVPVLEWDVFLDPTLVKKVDAAIDAAEEADCDDIQAQIAADIEVDRQIGRLIKRMMLAHGSASHLVSEAFGVASQYNFTKLVEEGESQCLYRRREAERNWKRSGLHFSRNGMDLGGKTWLANEKYTASLLAAERRSTVVAGKGLGSTKPAGLFVERWLALFLRAIHLAKAVDGVPSYGGFCAEDDESTPKAGGEVKTRPPFCGMLLCFGIEDRNALSTDHAQTSMADTARQILETLGSPLRVVLDLKSRRVPPRVWARLVDNLRSRGIVVEGLGSFDIDELRSVSSQCASGVTAVRFFHSAGDLQRACHAEQVHVGDTVFFNAGSLIWHETRKISNVVCGQGNPSHAVLDEEDDGGKKVKFHPFAYPSVSGDEDVRNLECQSTLQDYKARFLLNIGCYVQEFSISDTNLDALVNFLNKHSSIYNLGLAWGGINGKCPVGTSGDGYWNQRYMGRSWDPEAKPTEDMQLLHPEDHRLVQKAIMAGAWGHIGTVNIVEQEEAPEAAALHLGACAPQDATCG